MNIPYAYGNHISETKIKSGRKDQSIYECTIAESLATNIVESFGFMPTMVSKLKKILFNNLPLAKVLPVRISALINLLLRYGYNETKALDIIEDNITIILKDSSDLMHSLAIANQYGLDKYILLNNTIANTISSKLLYALVEEIKANDMEISEENVARLYRDLIYDKGSKEILEKYPLTDKKIFVLSFMYEKHLRDLESNLPLKK